MLNDTGKMATELPTNSTNGSAKESSKGEANFTVKTGLARMLKGGVIMDVINAEQVSTSNPSVCWSGQ
jgi:pyridoxal 5'-phosphate synthase pdxS subunit